MDKRFSALCAAGLLALTLTGCSSVMEARGTRDTTDYRAGTVSRRSTGADLWANGRYAAAPDGKVRPGWDLDSFLEELGRTAGQDMEKLGRDMGKDMEKLGKDAKDSVFGANSELKKALDQMRQQQQ